MNLPCQWWNPQSQASVKQRKEVNIAIGTLERERCHPSPYWAFKNSLVGWKTCRKKCVGIIVCSVRLSMVYHFEVYRCCKYNIYIYIQYIFLDKYKGASERNKRHTTNENSTLLTLWLAWFPSCSLHPLQALPQKIRCKPKTSWWFQPLWKILVKLDIFPKYGQRQNYRKF